MVYDCFFAQEDRVKVQLQAKAFEPEPRFVPAQVSKPGSRKDEKKSATAEKKLGLCQLGSKKMMPLKSNWKWNEWALRI